MSSAVPIESLNPGVSGNNNNSSNVSPNQNRNIGRRSPLMMPLMEAFRRRSKSDSKSSSTLDISKGHRSGSASGPSYGGRGFMNTIRSHIPWSDKRSISVDTSSGAATASPSPSPHTPSSLTASRESGFHALASHLSPVTNLPASSSSRLDPYYTYTYGQDPRYGSRGAGKSRRSAMDIFKRSDSLHQQQHHQHLLHQSSIGSSGSGATGSGAGKRSFDFGDLRENEHLVFVQFFKHYRCYDLIPVSAKLIVLDSQLMVKKAFHALVSNGVRSAPLWDASEQRFTGMLTITDFINILRTYYKTPAIKMEELEEQKLQKWKQLLQNQDQKPTFCTIDPYASLYDAIRTLIQQKVHRLPVIDRETGNVLYIMTHKRILKFLFLYYNELPLPRHLDKPIRELKLGTYENIATATMNTPLIDALHAFNERRVSALPVVDDDGKVIDVYAKFDVIVSIIHSLTFDYKFSPFFLSY